MRVGAIIVAAGKGRRMGAGKNKVYLEISGKTVLQRTVEVFENCEIVDEIVVVTDDILLCKENLKGFSKVKTVVLGGETRQKSVKNGLDAIDCDIAIIHDGARALICEEEIIKTIESAKKYGAAAVGVKSKDTLKKINKDGFIEKTIDRDFVYNIQTPQAFLYSEIKKLHEETHEEFTDDCALYESVGKKVKIVDGKYDNIKITTPEDLQVAEKILEKRKNK